MTGEQRIVEDGQLLRHKTEDPKMVELMKDIKGTFNLFTSGCTYRDKGSDGFPFHMSMYGSITDVQVFSRNLSLEEMVAFTTCSQLLRGEIISWQSTNWRLASPLNSTEVEVLDFEKDVCTSATRRNQSLLLVPQTMSSTEGFRICQKLSGQLASYTEREGFDVITHQLSGTSSVFSGQCSIEVGEGRRRVRVNLAGSDEQQEGDWRTVDTAQPIQHLPWAPNRPFTDGFQYNCLELQVSTRYSMFVIIFRRWYWR